MDRMDRTTSASTLINKPSTSAMEATNINGNVQQSNDSSQISRMDNVNEVRICWICLENDTDNPSAVWVHPCKCRGSTKWVHQTCLQRWIDERQKDNASDAVSCQQCKTKYVIVLPRMTRLSNVLDTFDNLIQQICPFLVGSMFIGSLHWAAITYGGITVLEIFGYKNGVDMLKNTDILTLLVGVPGIPIVLIFGRNIRWESAIIYLIHKCCRVARECPLLRSIMPYDDEHDEQEDAENPVILTMSPVRQICGALILPTASSIVGRIFFKSIDNTLYRALLGGFTFITVKGALKMYLRYQQYRKRNGRRIVDYTEENVRTYVSSTNNNNGGNANDNNNDGNRNHNRNRVRHENSNGQFGY